MITFLICIFLAFIIFSLLGSREMVCKDCGFIGSLKRCRKGSLLIEIVLWCCFLIPGLIYTLWRFSNKTYECPECHSNNLIPTTSPNAKNVTSTMPHPSPQLRSHSLIFNAVFALFVIIIFAAYLSSKESPRIYKNSPAISSSPVSITTERQEAAMILPREEQNFINILQAAQSKSIAAINDMQRGSIKAERDKAMCEIVKKMKIKKWIGKIITLDANSDGKGIVGIEVANQIKLTTWNNSFSDEEDKTLLNPDSEIFKNASKMPIGQTIYFSGSFRSGIDDDCIKESNFTLKGKLEEPEFIFKFTDIKIYH